MANAILFASCAGGAALTKYTTLPIEVTASTALLARGAWCAARHRSGEALRALAALLTMSVLITAPHWLKNWIWYGDPAYPMLRKVFFVSSVEPRPARAACDSRIHCPPGIARAVGPGRSTESHRHVSFVPNDWEVLRHDVPVFGSLFTLAPPTLLFLRGAKRLLWVYARAISTVFGGTWSCTSIAICRPSCR